MARKQRAVLVGCGSISKAWLDALRRREDVAMVGLVDVREAAARQRATEYELDSTTVVGVELERVLGVTKPDIVFDCTLPEAHADVAATAFRHGCHVFGEKPMAENMVRARSMLEAMHRAERVGAVMQNRRYDKNLRRLRAFLQSGAIGKLTTAHCRFLIGAHFGGFRDEMEHVLLLDMAIHTFDAARHLLSAEPRAVSCHEWNPPGSWYAHGASATATFEMGSGQVYTYQGSWCAEGLNTTWEGEWHLIGTEGSVWWDGADRFRAQRVRARGGFTSELEDCELPPGEDAPNGHAAAIEAYLCALAESRTPETAYSDNIKSLAMVHGAIESARRGARLALEP